MKYAPFGYRFEGDRLVQDEAEQAVLREAKRLRAAGLSEPEVKRLLLKIFQPMPENRKAIETVAREADVVACILEHRARRNSDDP